MDVVDLKVIELVEKAEDPNFKVAIQKWSSGKAQSTVVNEIGKVLKGSQPKDFLAWLLDLDVEDEALKKFKLKNDIIKQCVIEIEKLVVEHEQRVEETPANVEVLEKGEDVMSSEPEKVETVQVDDKVDTTESTKEEDSHKDCSKELDEPSRSGNNGNTNEDKNDPQKTITSDKHENDQVKSTSGNNVEEQHNAEKATSKQDKEETNNVEKAPSKQDKKEINVIHDNVKKSPANSELEIKTAALTMNSDGIKVSQSENKKDHTSKDHKGSHHSSKENKSIPSGGSKTDKHSIHTDKEKRKIKCGMCDDSFEAKSGSMISCENCKKPAHDLCVKKWLGCDLKLIMEKIVGIHLTWLCPGCKPSCKVAVVRDKVKKTSQATQTSVFQHRSHEKENRSHGKQDSKDHKTSHKKTEEKTTEEQVISIRKKLENVLESGGTNKKTLELLKSLERLSDINMFLADSIDLNILTSTKIGWTVNDIRKNSTDYEVVELAKVLIKKWKKIVPVNYRGDEISETPRKKKGVKQNDIKSVLMEVPMNKKENTATKIKEQDGERDTNSKSKDTGSKSKEKENKPKPKEAIKASFFENLKKNVEKKEVKKEFVEDEKSVRKTCKNMLLEAIKGDGSLPDDVKKADFDKLAASFEEAMFETFKHANKQYKNLVRSRVFNIKTNPSLRTGILSGNVTPARLVTMSSEEMANTNVKNQREKFCKEGIDRFVKTFGDMQLQGNPDLKITDFKIPKYLAPLSAPTGSSPTVSGLPSSSKVSDLTNAGYYSLK